MVSALLGALLSRLPSSMEALSAELMSDPTKRRGHAAMVRTLAQTFDSAEQPFSGLILGLHRIGLYTPGLIHYEDSLPPLTGTRRGDRRVLSSTPTL